MKKIILLLLLLTMASVSFADGEDLYKRGTCAACHDAGVADAPKPSDLKTWRFRNKKGLDFMIDSVIAGTGTMPPNGGTQYSPDEIKQIVQYMSNYNNTQNNISMNEK